uniref:Uncharacterized protein n=1 Tax=Anolis carolinensis TaxID=28377 RepID=A0A803TWF6_ANOCA
NNNCTRMSDSKKSSIPETIGPAKKKQSLPWWISEDDSDDGNEFHSGMKNSPVIRK